MSWIDDRPEVRNVRCGAADLNGQARGKRVPRKFAAKLEEEGTRFPFSILNLDIWGEDVEDSPLVFEAGDPDGVLMPTERGYVPMPWLNSPSALLPMWMFHEDGTPFAGDPFFERFFGGPQTRQREVNSLGSGVIVDASGVIVTNNHVVAGAQDLRVVLSDRREFAAELLLADERTDLAVLKIDADAPLPVMTLDASGTAEVGDLVLAIGNPFGVGQTVTSGIVSALARTDVGITDYAFFIQTDAAVNPGNSGGALVNMSGELIGVNTAIFSRSGGSQGIGFAIPAEMVRTVVAAAREGGRVVRPWLGARLQAVTSDLAQSFGLDRPQGAVVAELWPGGAAERGGLQRGDVVLAVDGQPVNDRPGRPPDGAARWRGADPDRAGRGRSRCAGRPASGH